MNIEDIQDNFRIGSEVSVILRTGHQFSGTLSEIREASIILRQSSGGKISLSAEAIDCIFPVQDTELSGGTAPVVQNSSVTPLPTSFPQQAPPSKTATPPPAPTPPIVSASEATETNTTYPIEVITQVVEIAARFKTAIQQANLEPLPPDFSLPDSISSMLYSQKKNKMQGEWNRLENQYKNAIKVKELSRLNQIIRGYEQILNNYPEVASVARFNMGCLYLALGQASEALKTFALAASYSREPRIFYNLGVVALRKKDTAKACYALQEFFKLTSISLHPTAWYKFLGLALDSGVVNVLSDLLKQALLKHKSDDAQLIVESAIFLLKENDRTDDAHRLMAFLQQRNLEPERTPELLESMLSQIALEPTEEYSRQQQELRNAQEQAKRQEEQIKRQKEVESFLSYARELARRGQYSQALGEIRKALQKDPENTTAKQLEAEYREAYKERGLPTGSGPYAQAKQAKESDQDFKKAEGLFREAIKRGDRAESAVKDLASLLQQQNRDKEAIQILQEYRPKAANQLSIDNMVVSIYQHARMYPEAIKLLTNLSKSTLDYKKRAKFLKQISFCQVKSEQFDKAESSISQLLKLTPNDNIAKQWLDGLQQAKKTGYYASLEQIFLLQDVLTDFGVSVSKFFDFYLDLCEYKGVDEAKIPSRGFSEEDLRKLKGLIEGAGRKRPGVRAQYNLSAAKLLMDLKSEEEQQIRSYLEDYAADMGDSSLLEQKHQDVALTYYLEAFAVATKWHRKLSEKFSRFIMSFYTTSRDEIIAENIPTPEKCLNEAFKKGRGRPLIEGLLELSLNRTVAEFLLPLINNDKSLKEKVQTLCYEVLGETGEPSSDFAKLTELWERGRETVRRRNEELIGELRYLESLASSLGSLPEQIERVQALGQKIRGNLDKSRLGDVNKILGQLSEYSQQQSYVERERLANIIKDTISKLIQKIEDSPTKYSLELLRSYLLSLDTKVEEDFAKVQQAAEPEELETTLSIDSYIPDSESNIQCQITIFNHPGKSPASAIMIQVEDSPADDYICRQKNVNVSEALPGGESVTREIPIYVTDKAKQSQVFTLYYRISYTTRAGKQVQTDTQTLPIRLDRVTDFKEINNPYAAWAEAGEVTDPTMFYGRDLLIENLVTAITNAPAAKSLVIYGQKRAGKSSILYHLERRLQLPIIPVKFSIGDISDISVASFLYRIIQRLEAKLKFLAKEGFPGISIPRPSITEFQEHTELLFHDYMSELQTAMKQESAYQNARIILLIDEFTYIYGAILRLKVPDTFMQFWKAMLQQGYFGSILVGQDVMRQFIARFPNEFQVAQSERVSYLAPDDARQLIINPILIPDTEESRYKGNAVKRLIELTAGSPFYIQIFCNRLVEYMNRKKLVRVTEAHIEQVKEELIKGNNSLTHDKFDNLISAYDDVIDAIPKTEVLAVLRDIAIGSRTQTYCERSVITALTSVPVDTILSDLIDREVVEKKEGAYNLFRLRVGLFKEWLITHQ